MKVFPQIKIARYEKLEPGDLFSAEYHGKPFFGLKCTKNADGDPNQFVALGSTFPYDAHEAFLLPSDGFTAISYGKEFSIILPTSPASWKERERADRRKPVCLAVADNEYYICANAGTSPQQEYPCFIHIATGKIIEGRATGIALYTHDWQIVVPGEANTVMTLIKFPLIDPKA